MTKIGCWYIDLKQKKQIPIYHGTADKNPFIHCKDMNSGEYWSLDIDDPEIRNQYPEDSNDDCFILIPKIEIERIYFQSNDYISQKIQKASIDTLFKKTIGREKK